MDVKVYCSKILRKHFLQGSAQWWIEDSNIGEGGGGHDPILPLAMDGQILPTTPF